MAGKALLTGVAWERWDMRTCRVGDSDKGGTATVTDVLLCLEPMGCTAGKSFGGSLDLWIKPCACQTQRPSFPFSSSPVSIPILPCLLYISYFWSFIYLTGFVNLERVSLP